MVNKVQAPTQRAVWLKTDTYGNGQAFVANRTLAALMQQMMSSGSSYLLTIQAKSPYRSNDETWVSYLESSGGVEAAYSSYPPGASTTERSSGLVLPKRTGQNSLVTRTQRLY